MLPLLLNPYIHSQNNSMKQLSWIFAVLILLSGNSLLAQAGSLGISAAYFGENVIHPGLKIGLDYTLTEEVKVRIRRNAKRAQKHGSITKRKQWIVLGNGAFYNHPNNHSALMLGAEIGRRRIREAKNKHKVRAFTLGVGYLQRIYNIDTYTLDEDGTLEQFKGGQSQFYTSVAMAFGRDLSSKDLPIAWHVKPIMFLIAPYSHSITFNAALELGITYQLD